MARLWHKPTGAVKAHQLLDTSRAGGPGSALRQIAQITDFFRENRACWVSPAFPFAPDRLPEGGEGEVAEGVNSPPAQATGPGPERGLMRTRRFESFVHDLIRDSGGDAIKSIQRFEEAGFAEKPLGLLVEFVTGVRLFLQFVRVSPPGGDNREDAEPILEGRPLASVDHVQLAVENGKLHLKNFESFLVAAIINSGNREIADVRTFASASHKFGIDVTFHNGAHDYVFFLYALAPGREPGFHPEFKVQEVI